MDDKRGRKRMIRLTGFEINRYRCSPCGLQFSFRYWNNDGNTPMREKTIYCPNCGKKENFYFNNAYPERRNVV